MAEKLHIAHDLALPLDFVVGTEADLATKGMGKTHLAQVLAEELLEHHQVFAAIDPTDAWWGLRSSADGKSEGYPVVVFGGDHANIQLEPDAGVALADFVMEERRSIVICTEGLTQSGEVRVVREFLERIYRKNREPLKLFVDEADMFAPQKPDDPEDAKSIRAMRNIVRRGRKKGIGCMMITQRPAELNKGVLNMCDTLFVLGMESPLDIDPIEKWTRSKDPKVQAIADEMIDSLTTLPIGDAWVVKKRAGLFRRFRARQKRTFDSGATPKPGQRVAVAKKLAPIDLKAVGEKIAAMVERQRAEDPKLLRARIVELEKQVAKGRPAIAAAPAAAKVIEKSVVRDAQLKRAELLVAGVDKAVERARAHAGTLIEAHGRVEAVIGSLQKQIDELRTAVSIAGQPQPAPRAIPNREIARATFAAERKETKLVGKHQLRVPISDPGAPSKMERAMLIALAERPQGLTRRKIRIYTGYADSGPTSKGFARLLAEGWAAERGGDLVITDTGRAAIGEYEPLPRGDALRGYLLSSNRLSTAEKKMLTVLCDAYPESLTRPQIRELTGYADSGPTSKAFSHLVGLDYVIDEGRAGLRAAEELFG